MKIEIKGRQCNKSMKKIIIDVELYERQTDALSQVLKRIGWTDIRRLSATDEEAYDAQYALEAIRAGLAKQGYNPR